MTFDCRPVCLRILQAGFRTSRFYGALSGCPACPPEALSCGVSGKRKATNPVDTSSCQIRHEYTPVPAIHSVAGTSCASLWKSVFRYRKRPACLSGIIPLSPFSPLAMNSPFHEVFPFFRNDPVLRRPVVHPFSFMTASPIYRRKDDRGKNVRLQTEKPASRRFFRSECYR